MEEWNKDLEKKILRKSRFTLTVRIVRIMLIVLFLYAIYMIVLNIVVEKKNIIEENAYFSKLAIEWTVPNVRGTFDTNKQTIPFWGSQDYSFKLTRKVGKDEILVGEATFTKSIMDSLSKKTVSHLGSEQLNNFYFLLPEDPRTNKKFKISKVSKVYETLEMLPEGTVGELAFSTNSYMEPSQLINELNEFDIDILWMPLYTGEFEKYEPYSWSSGENLLRVDGAIGLTGGMEHYGDHYISHRINRLDQTTIGDSKQIMLNNMEELLNKSPKYYGKFLGLSHLEEKYQFLQDDGFIVYGAVVTGPVKELLKLQNVQFIQEEQLGEVELWNWDEE